MTPPRPFKRASAADIERRIITVKGSKALRDADLAELFGISLQSFYQRIGPKLFYLRPIACIKLSERYSRGRLDSRPPLAFTQSGVIFIASVLGDDEALEIGMDIAHALKNRRRSSAQKKRNRREDDALKAARYHEALARALQGRLRELLKKLRH